MSRIKRKGLLVGGMLMAVAVFSAILALSGGGHDVMTYFRGGYVTQTGRMWMGALLAAVCGSAVIYISLKY
jgi:hypothetical protein